MRIGFLVNSIEELVATQTTTMLIRKAVQRGHRVDVMDVHAIEVDWTGSVLASSAEISPAPSIADTVDQLRRGSVAWRDLLHLDLVVIRTNPGRDADRLSAHNTALRLLCQLADRGLPVVNDPLGLLKSMDKLYPLSFSRAVRPPTFVSSDPDRLAETVRMAEYACVLKPLSGSWGQDVYKLDGASPELPTITRHLTKRGPVVVQPYLAGAPQGDIRVVMLDGVPLRVNGVAAAVRRVPAAGDFRSNIHAGGVAEPADLAGLEELVGIVGPKLTADGMLLAGLDIIDRQLLEVNVFATGGLRDAERFGGVDFSEAVVRAFERRITRAIGASGPEVIGESKGRVRRRALDLSRASAKSAADLGK